MHSEKLSLDELYTQCKLVGIPWMVIVRDKTYTTKNTVKVKSVEKRVESDVNRDDLAEYMVRLLKNKEQLTSAPLPTAAATMSHEPSTLATHSTIDVMLLSQDAGKLKKKISQMATQKVMPALKKFATNNIVKVGAVDLPLHLIKEIAVAWDRNSESLPILDKYPRYRDKFLQVSAFLQKNKNSPFVVLYSYKEDNFEFMILA
jgi:hypothetical protein